MPERPVTRNQLVCRECGEIAAACYGNAHAHRIGHYGLITAEAVPPVATQACAVRSS